MTNYTQLTPEEQLQLAQSFNDAADYWVENLYSVISNDVEVGFLSTETANHLSCSTDLREDFSNTIHGATFAIAMTTREFLTKRLAAGNDSEVTISADFYRDVIMSVMHGYATQRKLLPPLPRPEGLH